MDEQARLLLHKFAISGDPDDAVSFANVMLRLTNNEATYIWICEIYEGSDEGSMVEGFFTHLDALLNAVGEITERIKNSWLDYYEGHPDERRQAQKMIDELNQVADQAEQSRLSADVEKLRLLVIDADEWLRGTCIKVYAIEITS